MTERLPFVMDELVDTQIGCQVGRGIEMYSEIEWERTPLMTYLISAITKSANNSFSTVIHVRKLMWFGTVIIFFLTYFIARNIYGSRIAFSAILLLCGFTTFLDRSIRIRADLVSTTFSMPVLWILTCSSLHPIFLSIAGLFLGLAVLTTQKAIYFVASFAVALVGRQIILSGINLQSLKKILLNGIIAIAGFAVPIIPFLIWMHVSGRMEQFIDQCFFRAATIGFISKTYRHTWNYFLETILSNPAFWCLGLIGMFILLYEGIKSKLKPSLVENKIVITAPGFALSLWTFTLFVLILQHKVKFPYLFLNIAPSLAICGSLPLGRIILLFMMPRLRLNWTRLVFALLSLLILIIEPSLHHKKRLKNDLIKVQSAIMNRIDSITNPEDAVFDGIGIAVTRKKATPYSMTVRWRDEREAGAKYDIIGQLKKSQPKVLVWNYRMEHLRKNEQDFLNTHFVLDWANVYVVGTTVSHRGPETTNKTINLLSSAKYAIVADDRSRILLDGEVPDSFEFLAAGNHEIIINGESQELLLKYLPSVKVPTPPPHEKFILFPSY